jgi:AcrR family transcriptional regulator
VAPQLIKRDRRDSAVRRARIIDEAIGIIGQRGYHGFTVHGLAARCDLSNAGLLYYFPSKEQLFDAVLKELEHRKNQALAALIAAVARKEGDLSSLTAYIDLLRAMAIRGSGNPELVRFYAVLQIESLDETHPAHRSFQKRELAALDLFTRLLAPHVKEPRSAARQLLALMDGLRLQWLRSGQSFDAVSEWIRAVAALVPAVTRLREEQTFGFSFVQAVSSRSV